MTKGNMLGLLAIGIITPLATFLTIFKKNPLKELSLDIAGLVVWIIFSIGYAISYFFQ